MRKNKQTKLNRVDIKNTDLSTSLRYARDDNTNSTNSANKANKTNKANSGFTLIELLLVIALIAILAAAILVSISGQKQKAQASKVVLELSGMIQPIMMCFSDGENIKSDLGKGTEICEVDGYGKVPNLPTDWTFHKGNLNNSPSSASWYYSAGDGTTTVCCNATYAKCSVISGSCNNSTVLSN